MPTVPVANGVRAEMIYTNAGQRMENVYYFSKGVPATAADLLALWTLLKDWENNTAKLRRVAAVNLVLIKLTALDTSTSPVYEAAVLPAIAGSNNVVGLPSVVSLAVKHTTGFAGRSKRGRTYWIGAPVVDLADADKFSITYVNNVAAVYNSLRTVLAAAGWTFMIASLYSGVDSNGKQLPRTAGILTPVLASSAEVGVDTQRHRKAPYQV